MTKQSIKRQLSTFAGFQPVLDHGAMGRVDGHQRAHTVSLKSVIFGLDPYHLSQCTTWSTNSQSAYWLNMQLYITTLTTNQVACCHSCAVHSKRPAPIPGDDLEAPSRMQRGHDRSQNCQASRNSFTLKKSIQIAIMFRFLTSYDVM